MRSKSLRPSELQVSSVRWKRSPDRADSRKDSGHPLGIQGIWGAGLLAGSWVRQLDSQPLPSVSSRGTLGGFSPPLNSPYRGSAKVQRVT